MSSSFSAYGHSREPTDVLQFLVNPDTYSITCVGQTQTNRRCRNIIAMRDVSSAKILLQNLPDAARDPSRLEQTLQQLAALMLCKRWHVHDQAQHDRIVSIWKRQIREVLSRPSPSPAATPPAPSPAPLPAPRARQPQQATQVQRQPARIPDRPRYLIEPSPPIPPPSTPSITTSQSSPPPPPPPAPHQHQCTICLDDLGTNGRPEALPCAHVFCSGCIAPWRQYSSRCPLCRHDETQSVVAVSSSSSTADQHEQTAVLASSLQSLTQALSTEAASATTESREDVSVLEDDSPIRPADTNRTLLPRARSGVDAEIQRPATPTELQRPSRAVESAPSASPPAATTANAHEIHIGAITISTPRIPSTVPITITTPAVVTSNLELTPVLSSDDLTVHIRVLRSPNLDDTPVSSFSQTTSIVDSSDGSSLGSLTDSRPTDLTDPDDESLSLEEEEECGICLEGMHDRSDVPEGRRRQTRSCGHAFHTDCIQRWCRQSPSCPYRCP